MATDPKSRAKPKHPLPITYDRALVGASYPSPHMIDDAALAAMNEPWEYPDTEEGRDAEARDAVNEEPEEGFDVFKD